MPPPQTGAIGKSFLLLFFKKEESSYFLKKAKTFVPLGFYWGGSLRST
jgi:hypothetical protein